MVLLLVALVRFVTLMARARRCGPRPILASDVAAVVVAVACVGIGFDIVEILDAGPLHRAWTAICDTLQLRKQLRLAAWGVRLLPTIVSRALAGIPPTILLTTVHHPTLWPPSGQRRARIVVAASDRSRGRTARIATWSVRPATIGLADGGPSVASGGPLGPTAAGGPLRRWRCPAPRG